MPEEKGKNTDFINPIDADKIAANPHTLPYAHTVGGVEIKPIDRGKVKGRAVQAMYEQTDMQMEQLRKQFELLAKQAKALRKRVLISENIYQAEMHFEPLVGFTYHLFQRANGRFVLSMVAPDEWGPNPPYHFVATVKMLADHTWDILQEGDITLNAEED